MQPGPLGRERGSLPDAVGQGDEMNGVGGRRVRRSAPFL
ncbi:hypothetical protein RAJCM14343_0505 [Rhodococcus aetherivorans]|uniref:Uncharacterized protein n=1 Tax=Rhodococcus aetherivorans TaxID=191292 RepID=A0ABQ0YFI1_9NOCA|nr:hypothetical protein RAJCM14343_0505 [Rhodococcus aetherivorans]